MSADQQFQSPIDLSLPRSQAADTAPIPPLRSPKRSPARTKIGNPLSDVPTNDSRRNSPSTADHQRYLLQQHKNSDAETQNNSFDLSDSKSFEARENIHLSPNTKNSAMSFWYDKERESLNESRSPTIDGSPIINSSVRNSIFHQNTGNYQRPLPSSPVIQSPTKNDETRLEQDKQESPVGIAKPRHVALEKRSSLLSSSGSIRSKKVTFEMAPPQVVEFESTQDPPITAEATSEESEDDEVSGLPARLATPNHVIDKPTSPLMKFESSFSPGVYLHRTLSGSRSLPKPSAHTFNTKGRPLPAVPSKQSDNLDPQKITISPQTAMEQSETSLARQDSVMSRVSEASSYDAMDLLDSYTFDDVTIDSDDVRDEFDVLSDSEPETATRFGDDHAVSQSSTDALLACNAQKVMHSDGPGTSKADSDGQVQDDSSISNCSPEISSVWSGDSPASSPHDVSVEINERVSNGYESIDLSDSRDTNNQARTHNTTDTTPNSAHTRTDSTTSFKLELPFDATDNDFGSGLNDYLNSTTFLAQSWTDDSDSNSTSVDAQLHCDIPAEDRTIKSTCGAKTRPSLTPADAVRMASTRRKVSGDHGKHKFLDLPSAVEDLPKPTGSDPLLLDLDMNDFSFDSLSKEFDRVMEVQRRGYLMRQNTRIVYAYADTDFNESSEKTYQPWTGAREPKKDKPSSGDKSSVKNSIIIPEKEQRESESSVKKSLIIPDDNKSDLDKTSKSKETKLRQPVETHNEEMKPAKPMSLDADATVDPADRGRLFVKVLALKDLKLPLNDDTSAYFALTLDNGIHCVTTTYMNLTRNAPIYQEFELIVGTDLEFILTLKAKLTRPETPVSRSPSPKKKESRFAIDKLFGSPKRRTQAESVSQSSPLALDHLLGSGGSFARSYISFSQIEKEIYLTSKILEVPCYNEWATEFDASRSRKAERVRTPPYPIGKIVLQLLYYPKTHRHQEIPRSLNACLRELNNGRQ
ncbi:hypothetical protein V1525DRAFT_392735 [Lipomyces kononenkoae]|uniref:Uncharacterized protein n=1 Tax=Lipomyces kononenkoae TaxID=34357 RepID=A0ACC3TBL4_LIPKO